MNSKLAAQELGLDVLKKFIKKDDTIIIGVSGGPDSMYLLSQCIRLKKIHPFNIVVAHVNHNLRGQASNHDANFVKTFTEKHTLVFEQKKLQKIEKSSLKNPSIKYALKGNMEEICRKARYAFFEKLRQKYKAAWILTAHHRDDNTETVLFNLVRGSFLNGLKGMETASLKRYLLRPLLKTSKNEILEYLKKNNITYRMDHTNKNLQFSRNLLRHKVIPLFQKINPDFQKTFAENLKDIRNAADFIDTYCIKWLMQNWRENMMPLKKFLEQESIIQKTILATLYKNLYGSSNKFNQKHLNQILQILHREKSKRKKEFGDKYFIEIKKKTDGLRVIHMVKNNKSPLKESGYR